MVTSGIFRSVGAQSFGGAHRGRVCVRMFIGVSVHVCVGVCVILCNSQKKRVLLAVLAGKQHLWQMRWEKNEGKGCRGLGEAFFLLLELNS